VLQLGHCFNRIYRYIDLLSFANNSLRDLSRILNGISYINTLDFSNNSILFVNRNLFEDVVKVERVIVNSVPVCCIAGNKTNPCSAKPAYQSECDPSLLSNMTIRCITWIMSIIVILLNMTVFWLQTNKT
jgi:hypothetical protein